MQTDIMLFNEISSSRRTENFAKFDPKRTNNIMKKITKCCQSTVLKNALLSLDHKFIPTFNKRLYETSLLTFSATHIINVLCILATGLQ